MRVVAGDAHDAPDDDGAVQPGAVYQPARDGVAFPRAASQTCVSQEVQRLAHSATTYAVWNVPSTWRTCRGL